MEMYDVRPMHEIAADFHGLEGYTVTDDEGVRTFTDYNTLQNIARKVGGIVEITMEKASALEA